MPPIFLSLSALEIVLGLCVLVLLIRARELKTYWPMLILSMWQVIPFFTLMYLRAFQKGHMAPRHAYLIYYFTYWVSFVIAAGCAIGLTYTILHGALRPLKGLQSLAWIVYFWAAGISVFIAIDNSQTVGTTAYRNLQNIAIHFQRATGIITVSLVLFVCLAIRPMGLSIRSRVFGTGVGLAVLSISNTIGGNYAVQNRELFTNYSIVQSLVCSLAEAVWAYYFLVPEPKRKFVLLATTSPFHRWNAIAEQFGQSAGYVAIGGIPPDAFASAEIEVFHRASAKMNAMEGTSSSFLSPRTDDDTKS